MTSAVIRVFVATTLTAGLLCAATVQRSAADTTLAAGRSVADGVYSEAQKRRGMSAYMKECSSCHGESFRGAESSPPLKGPDFMMHWNGRSLSELLDKMRLMPPNEPGRLSVEQAADVIAVVLSVNGFPAGSSELPATAEQLQQIHIVDTP